MIRLKRTKNIALHFLCLAIVMIPVTLIHISSLRAGGSFNSVWAVYWLVISTEVELAVTAATAFRALFITHYDRVQQSFEGGWKWYTRSKQLLQYILNPRRCRRNTTESSRESGKASEQAVKLLKVAAGGSKWHLDLY